MLANLDQSWTVRLFAGCALFALLTAGCVFRTAGDQGSDHVPISLSSKPRTLADEAALEANLKESLSKNPKDPIALSDLGVLYAREKRWFASKGAFEQALSLSPHDVETRIRFCEMLLDSGDAHAALRQADRARAAEPSHVEARAWRGKSLWALGRNDEAAAEWSAAWKSTPPSVTAGIELARLDVARGEPDEAARRLRTCLAQHPNNVSARRLYAEVLEKEGKPFDAIREWEWLLDRGEAGLDGYLHLADLRGVIGDVDAARVHLASANRVASGDPAIGRASRRLDRILPNRAPNANYPPLIKTSDSIAR